MGNIYEELRAAQGNAKRGFNTRTNFRSQINSEIETTLLKIERTVKDFDKKDRKSLLGAAATAVRKEARIRTRRGKRVTYIYKRRGPKRDNKPRSRTGTGDKNAQEIKNVGARGGRLSSSYAAGNLEKSIRVLRFRSSPDVFVGPKFRGGGIGKGTSTTNADGFYADWAYGGKGEFKKKVLIPAAQVSETVAIEKIRKKAVQRFKDRAKQQGLDVS